MTKKARSSAKKANSFSMGRILFYSIALVVACCAVAVVLFETETGQGLVAKVRGEKSSNNGAKTETRHSERKATKESGEPRTAKRPESAERELPREENVLRREDTKDTSPNPSDNPNEASESRNEDPRKSSEARRENSASETPSAKDEEFSISSEAQQHIDETASGQKEDWEIIDEEIDEEADRPVEEQDKPVEEQEKPAEDPTEEREKPVEEQDKPVVELDKPVEEQDEAVHEPEKPVEKHDELIEEPVFVEYSDRDGNVEETEQNLPESGNEVGEKEQDDRKGVEQEVENGEVEEGETITVGDSLADLEEQRSNEHLIVEEEERYDPIPEPEGPPIDQSPVNARRGLRGDYGGKGGSLCNQWTYCLVNETLT